MAEENHAPGWYVSKDEVDVYGHGARIFVKTPTGWQVYATEYSVKEEDLPYDLCKLDLTPEP